MLQRHEEEKPILVQEMRTVLDWCNHHIHELGEEPTGQLSAGLIAFLFMSTLFETILLNRHFLLHSW